MAEPKNHEPIGEPRNSPSKPDVEGMLKSVSKIADKLGMKNDTTSRTDTGQKPS